MNRIFCLLVALAATAAAWAQGGSGVGYDPVNPPDPQQAYRLTLTCSPEKGGSVSPGTHTDHLFGDNIYIWTSTNTGYKFRAWMEGDSVVSTSEGFSFTMPARNVTFTACFDAVPYDPANPGDPSPDGYYHRVKVNVDPPNSGWINNSDFEMKEGDEQTLYAYPNSTFKFSHWKVGDKIVSTSQDLPIRMATENLEFTARFVYAPASPADPLPNLWNEATGELIIDHFTPGSLWDAITQIVGYDNTGKVTSLTVIGRMDNYDMGVVRNLPQLTDADFSRTSGSTSVPGWIFQRCPALTRVLLPSSIQTIEYGAFSGCSNLQEMVVYAAMPPTIDSEYTFSDVPESMVVKVYSSSLEVYESTPIWRNYKIMTIDEDSTSLVVELPEDAADGRYRNASLQLSNHTTGQTQRLIITGNRVKYVFGNLIPDSKYSLYVLSPNGTVIGSELGFEITKGEKSIQLKSLTQLQEVKLSFLASDGSDVSASANISWFDERHTFLGNGAVLPACIAGDKLTYEASLPRELGIVYANPEPGEWTVTEDNNVIETALVPFAKMDISGILTDAVSGQPVSGGFVTVSQTLNGQFDVAATANTASDGSYKLTVYEAPGILTAGSPEHVDSIASFTGKDDVAAVATTAVKPLEGTEIEISLLARENIAVGATENAFIPFEDFANVNYEVTNLTKGINVDFRMRYPHMMLLGQVDEGDQIQIVARPTKASFNPSKAETVISGGKADAKFTFVSNGDIRIAYVQSDAPENIAMLYNEDGKLMRKAAFLNKKASFTGLSDGKYTVVTMCASRLFSGSATLGELSASKLTAGQDYLMHEIEVNAGYYTAIDIDTLPTFDESMFYYTGSETSVSVNKTSVIVGATVTVRAKVDFLPQYRGSIDKVNMIFALPEGCDYVDNSLLVAGGGANFTTISDGRLSVEVPAKDASVRFCIIPREGGEYRPGGKVEFWLNGETISQPIGSALFTAGDFTLSVPEKTSVARVTARGGATALSEVKVYDNDVFVGTTRTLTNGEWRLSFDLYNPGDFSEHFIRAEITSPAGAKYRTAVSKTIYDKEWAELTDIEMIYGGHTIDFNHINATTSPTTYSYIPENNMFTFKTVFREGHVEKVTSLDFVILLSDGSRRRMTGKYMSNTDAWVCAIGFDDMNRLPVNVKAYYAEKRDGELLSADIVDNTDEPFRCPDVIPVIDPSGYVYEAVPSQRIEGVEATIFYKELAENMYGEVIEKAVKWDAEAYAQQNPLFTDAEGMYQWDVPSGEWQVRFEKEGYEVATTEWLPVPPPQLDVNVGLVQTVRPQVKEAHAYENAVTVEFDKFMIPAYLNNNTIVVTVNGEKVDGTVTLVNAEENAGASYASAVRFEAAKPFDATNVTVMVSNKVMSYAGIQMEEAYVQEFTVEPEITAIQAPETVEAWVGTEGSFTVIAEPAEAAAGKTLLMKVDSSVASAAESVQLDAEGKAVVKFKAELPGTANISMSVENAQSVSAVTRLMLSIMPDSAATPVASIESGAVLPKGTTVALSTESEEADIYYTIDGTSPADSETRTLYTAPIVINTDVTILAIAGGKKYLNSSVAEFKYTVQVAKAPIASVESGIVAKGTEVFLTSTSEGVNIYYTVDGTSPVDSESRTLYSEPIVINADVTIKAMAYGEKYLDSPVAEFKYTVQVAAKPQASVESGFVAKGTEIELTSTSEGVSIYYTTDGTSPIDSETRTLYANPIVVSADTTILAVAQGPAYIDSEVSKFEYSVQVAKAPVASVMSGVVAKGTEVVLSCETEGVDIYYTTDGTSPIDSETRILYTAPIVINADVTIKAVVQSPNYIDSPIAEFTYTVQVAEAPVASVESGIVAKGTEVVLTSASEGVDIYFTTDGTSPLESETRTLYAAPIVINVDVTIKAVAVSAAYIESDVAEFTYTVQVAEAPVASVESGIVAKGTEVVLTSASEGVDIYFTTDGTSPLESETRTLYTAPIVINADVTIKAVAVSAAYIESDVVEFSYTVQVAKAPVASVESGIVAKGTEVFLTSTSESVDIYFTTDGTSPLESETRTLYTAPIVINADVTIKAVAVSAAYIESDVAEFSYTVQVAEAPVASVESGMVAKGTEVVLTSASEGVDIYFTTDGTSPLESETRTLYTAPIVINADVTIKAVALSTAYIESGVVEFSYTVQVAKAPVASVPTESMIDEGDFIELSCPTEGAEIYYTLDGTSPLDSPSRILYTDPIEIKVETRILAIAVSDAHLPSEVAEFHYTINPESGINKPGVSTLKLAPIPSNNGFEVSGIEGRRCIVAVYNEAGIQAMATCMLTEDTIVEMTEHAPGLYIVVAQCGRENATLKLIKR